MQTTTYFESALVRRSGPFSGEMIKATGALCPDGKRRNAFPSFDGIADTFFSIPAFVYAGRTRVYGYVTIETVAGFSIDSPDDPATVKFCPYLYRKNHHLIEPAAAVWSDLAPDDLFFFSRYFETGSMRDNEKAGKIAYRKTGAYNYVNVKTEEAGSLFGPKIDQVPVWRGRN